MASYGSMVVTNQGHNLYAKVQAGAALKFTRMQIGGGQLAPGQDPATLTALITPIAYFSISSLSSSGSNAIIKGLFDNSAFASSTYTCEIGLFATDPDLGEILYAYANAGTQGDTIPPISAGPFSKQYSITTAVGNATNVTATIPTGSYATLDSHGRVDSSELTPNALAHGPSLTALLHFESALLSTRGLAATFTRNSPANNPETLAPLAANQPAYVTGKFGKAVSINEGTTNLVENSDSETVTGTATVFSDPLTSYSGSSAAPWAVQSGNFTFGASGATSGANFALMLAGNSAWKPIVGSGGQNLALTAYATFAQGATVAAQRLYLYQDSSNDYHVIFNGSGLYLQKGSTVLTSSTSVVAAANTTYTITLSRDTAGVLTAKLYSGTGTGGTLLQTLTATDTSLSGGFLVGVGGDTGVVISGVSVKAPWANGWTIGGDARVAWALTTAAISGTYSVSAVGVGAQGLISQNLSGVSTSTTYTFSMYANGTNAVAGTLGHTAGLYFGPSGTINNYVPTGTTSTARLITTATTGASISSTALAIEVYGSGTYTFDAIQLEAKSYATPYVQNNSTSTSATRAAETLTLPSSVLNAAAGTISLWVNRQIPWKNWGYIWDAGVNQTSQNFHIETNASGTVSFYVGSGSACNYVSVSAQGTFALITASWNSGTVKLYENGVLKATGTYSGSLNLASNMYIGTSTVSSYPMDAVFDELAIFNRALTDAEVYSLYAATQPLIDVFASDAQTLAGLTPAQITTNIPNTALTGPLVSSVTGNNGITVSNPTGVGAATLGLSGVPNSALAGPQVSSITAGQNISVSNPGGVGAATVGLSGVVPVANGGTGSATQNFVDLSSTQTVGGAKTFSSGVSVNSGLAVNSGGATVYSGADFGLQAAVGSPNDAGDLVFRNYDGTTRARIHAGVGSTPQLTLNAGGTDRVTIDNSGNMSVQSTISFGGGLTTMNTDLNLNGPSSTYASTAASVKVGSILATDNYGEARPSGEGHIAAKYGMTVGGNTVWHAGNASGGAWVWELFQGRVYATTNSTTAGNTDYSYDTGTSAGGATPTGGALNYKFLWQAGLATGKSVYFEALIEGGTGTAFCALKDLTTSTLYGQISTTASGTPCTRVRSGAISLVDGHEYAIALWGTGSGTIMTEARLIII